MSPRFDIVARSGGGPGLGGGAPIDVSRPIRPGALVYPGDPPVRLDRVASIGPDSPCQLTELAGSVHMMTHLEAPAHFIPGGLAIDQIPMDRLAGPAWVIDVPADASVIVPGDLPPLEALAGQNVLFRTRHSFQDWGDAYDAGHVGLSVEAARALAGAGVNLVGVDYLDLEAVARQDDPARQDYPAHRALLGVGILILEGLDLSQAAPGRYFLTVFPLKLQGAEAAPCRAVLWPQSGRAGGDRRQA